MAFDVKAIRAQFPLLERPIVYLDSAATAQKPRAVLDAMARFDTTHNAPVHRGVYPLSEEAAAAYEGARTSAARFVGADAGEIVFTRGTTDGINLVAQSFGRGLEPGDEVVVTGLEHHSNLVPWQMLCAARGARLRVLPVDERGDVVLEELGPRTRLVAATMVSNALGTITPVAEFVAAARRVGAAVLLDAAQAAPHLPLDVRALDCDFLVFSGHKVYGPTGIGILYGRAEVLAAMPPAQGGGEMVRRVTYERATYADPPHRFEAGTPPVAAAVGLGAALDWLAGLDRAAARAHEDTLVERARRGLAALPGVRVVGDPRRRAAVAPFVVDGVHAHDVAAILARDGVCVRAGHLCAQPLLERMGTPAVARASAGIYTTALEIDRLLAALARVREVFGFSDDLYQALILDHSRRPHALPAAAGRRAEVDNPFCGDTVVVAARLDGERIAEVGWEGEGCALMKASASMMTDIVRGVSAEAVAAARAQLDALLASGAGEAPGDLGAFAGVAGYPSRRRCATLPWEALARALR